MVLQKGIALVEGGTSSSIETTMECDVDGTDELSYKVEEAIHIKDEVSIKLEKAIDIMDEIPEAIIFPPRKQIKR